MKATQQLQAMSGQTVIFQTAVAVVCAETGFEQVDLAPVEVKFRALSSAEIERYLRAEEPYDCAGSAKSEGLGISLLDAILSDDPTAFDRPAFDSAPAACCRRWCCHEPGHHPSPVAAVTASSDQKRGRLFLVPAPLDFGCEQQAPLEDALPRATIGQAAQLSHWMGAKTPKAPARTSNAWTPSRR